MIITSAGRKLQQTERLQAHCPIRILSRPNKFYEKQIIALDCLNIVTVVSYNPISWFNKDVRIAFKSSRNHEFFHSKLTTVLIAFIAETTQSLTSFTQSRNQSIEGIAIKESENEFCLLNWFYREKFSFYCFCFAWFKLIYVKISKFCSKCDFHVCWPAKRISEFPVLAQSIWCNPACKKNKINKYTQGRGKHH